MIGGSAMSGAVTTVGGAMIGGAAMSGAAETIGQRKLSPTHWSPGRRLWRRSLQALEFSGRLLMPRSRRFPMGNGRPPGQRLRLMVPQLSLSPTHWSYPSGNASPTHWLNASGNATSGNASPTHWLNASGNASSGNASPTHWLNASGNESEPQRGNASPTHWSHGKADGTQKHNRQPPRRRLIPRSRSHSPSQLQRIKRQQLSLSPTHWSHAIKRQQLNLSPNTDGTQETQRHARLLFHRGRGHRPQHSVFHRLIHHSLFRHCTNNRQHCFTRMRFFPHTGKSTEVA